MLKRAPSRRPTALMWAALMALLVASVASLLASPRPARAASSAAQSTCVDVLFLGARGSDEKATSANLKMGDVVMGAYNEYRNSLRGKRLAGEPLDYPALAVEVLTKKQRAAYFGGLDVGVDRALATLRSHARDCPAQHFVLAGYSQGAMVMHRVIWELADSKFDLSRVDGVVAIGDGDRLPGKGETQYGTATNGKGVSFRFPKLAGQKYKPRTDTLPKTLGKRFRSVCLDYDIVCDTNLAHVQGHGAAAVVGVKNHEKYPKGKPGFKYVAAAARAAAATSTAVVIKPPDGPVDPGPVQIITTALPEALVGEPYAFRLATSDNRPGRWRLVSGVLPTGLVLDVDNGQIAGAPTATGTHAVRVGFLDGRGHGAERDLTLTVTQEPDVDHLAAGGQELPLPADAITSSQSAPASLIDCAPTSGNTSVEQFCAAAGNYVSVGDGYAPFVSTIDGQSAATVRLPAAVGQGWSMAALDCPARHWCAAAGPAANGTAVATIIDGAAEVRLVTAADLVDYAADGSETLTLPGLACPAPGECALAGTLVVPRGSSRAVVGTLDASGLHVRLAPLPGTAREGESSELRQLACATGGVCVALGSFTPDHLLVQRYTGGTWSADPDQGVGPSLRPDAHNSIACPTNELCYALGFSRDPDEGTWRTEIVRVVPGSWSVKKLESVHPERLSGTVDQHVIAIACASATLCYAVGSETQKSYEGSYPNIAAVAYDNRAGAWTGVELPAIADTDAHETQGRIDALACPTRTRCVVSGTAYLGRYGSGSRVGVSHLVGGSVVETAISPMPQDSRGLYPAAIGCSSRTRCLSSGYYHSAERQAAIPYITPLSLS